MTETFSAVEISPVPPPTPDAAPPELFRGIYGMPMFVTVPCPDLELSAGFWTRALGFFELFSLPGRLIHLRRWAFQDVLLVPTEASASSPSQAPSSSAVSVSFACVASQIDGLARACRAESAALVDGPRDTAWNTRDVTVVAPEGTRIVMTAGRPFEQGTRPGSRHLGLDGDDPTTNRQAFGGHDGRA